MNNRNTILFILFSLVTLVHLCGMQAIDIMDVDASQYASISMEMLFNGEYLQVQHRGADYLDKPPFLFWISALSFKIFGISNFSYRLPSFLFILLGTWSVHRLGALLYNRLSGAAGALIFYSSQAIFLIAHDVRTDTILVSLVVFATWQILAFTRTGKWICLVGGFTGVAIAMLEKGPIGLMVPVLALSSQFVWERSWKNFVRWQWLVGLVITAILLLPMCWGLWQQFDLQPEKVINGVKGESGLRFFFWTQSFGRLTGENVWKNDTGPLFFVHNYAWAFLPWTIAGIAALWWKMKFLFRSRLRFVPGSEMLTIGGFLLPFIALSFSKYKLPHYIFVTFPFIAILTGAWLAERSKTSALKGLNIVQLFIGWVLTAGILMLTLYVFPLHESGIWLVIVVMLGLAALLWFRTDGALRILGFSVVMIAAANFTMNMHFYPRLLNYQSGSVAARYIQEQNIPADQVYFFNMGSHAFDFYRQRITPVLDIDQPQKPSSWIFTNEDGKKILRDKGFRIRAEKPFPSISVTLLTAKFLNPETRTKATHNNYLLHVEKP